MQGLVDVFAAASTGSSVVFGIIVLLAVGVVGAFVSNVVDGLFTYLRRRDEVLDEIMDEALDRGIRR